MPPSLQPIPVRILDNIETVLASINGGSTYWHTVLYVKIGESLRDATTTPILTIGDVGEIGRYYEAKDGAAIWHGNYHWSIAILGAIDGKFDAPRQLMRLAADVYKALMADPYRGVDGSGNPNAVKTLWEGWRLEPASGPDDTRSWMSCLIDVHFRTRDTDMSIT